MGMSTVSKHRGGGYRWWNIGMWTKLCIVVLLSYCVLSVIDPITCFEVCFGGLPKWMGLIGYNKDYYDDRLQNGSETLIGCVMVLFET